jgi:hypothetical protein
MIEEFWPNALWSLAPSGAPRTDRLVRHRSIIHSDHNECHPLEVCFTSPCILSWMPGYRPLV